MPPVTVIANTARSAYQLFKRGKKARDFYNTVKATIDEDTRSGTLFKLGIKYSTDVLGKLLGESLSSHPYFKFHKAHLEILAQALNISSIRKTALETFNKAVTAADSAESLAQSLRTYDERRQALLWDWHWSLEEFLRLSAQYAVNPSGAAREIADMGTTPGQMTAVANAHLEEWRAGWAELCLDCLGLLGMVDMEYRMAEAAMTRYNEKLKSLEQKGSLGKIASYSVQQDRYWEEFDRMENPTSGKSEDAIEDPSGFARKQRDAIDAYASTLADNCDVVMSDAVRKSTFLIASLKTPSAR